MAGRSRAKKMCSSRDDTHKLMDVTIWASLPEEILELIIEKLPFAAQCRARCLSWQWRTLQPVPPSRCSIMCGRDGESGESSALFYCDSEQKWISLPCSKQLPDWELIDADGGLVCYQCCIDGRFWLCVCNPLMQRPSLSGPIPPDYDEFYRQSSSRCLKAPRIKLLVDRAHGTYAIVADLETTSSTAVYDSTTCLWTIYEECSPYMMSLEFFVWGGVIVAYSTEKDLKKAHPFLRAFDMETRTWIHGDMETRTWIRVPLKIPSEVSFSTRRLFMSNNKEVLLVVYSSRKRNRPYISVWKLLQDEGSDFAFESFSNLENWKKVEIPSPSAVVDLRHHRLARASYHGEHLCFVFTDDSVNAEGSRAYKCLRYSFSTKSWSEMPCRRDVDWGQTMVGLHTCEPSLDLDPSSSISDD